MVIKNRINPAFSRNLGRRKLRITLEKTSWPCIAGKRHIAAVNNFSAAGGNTMVALGFGDRLEMMGLVWKCFLGAYLEGDGRDVMIFYSEVVAVKRMFVIELSCDYETWYYAK